MLQASFAYNDYYCTKAKPAESLPNSNPDKQIQKNHIQSKPIIQSADSEILSQKHDQESCDALAWLAKVLGNQMQLSIFQTFELTYDKTIT